MKKYGVLIVNLGTPDTPEKSSVRAYLREFLMDKQVINLPFLLRFFLVNAIIIPNRITKVTEPYQSIGQDDSPIREILSQQANKLQKQLQHSQNAELIVEAAMT